jgi:virulence-associated protein VagC
MNHSFTANQPVILSPKPSDWSEYLSLHAIASKEFMEGVEDLPVPERSLRS